MKKTRFEWDANKDADNQEKHGIPFSLAQYAFADPCRVIAEDLAHSELKNAFFVSARSRAVFSLSVLPIAAVLYEYLAPVIGERAR